jgi:two-component system chemotaxis response regulator CheB
VRLQGPIRVLLIDDAPGFRRDVAAGLERHADVHVSVSGGTVADVREHLMQGHPEVILLDLQLRTGDPLLLVRKLRVHYPAPVIVAAEMTDAGTRHALQAAAVGALDVVRKPGTTDAAALDAYTRGLLQKIRVAVSSARPVPRTFGAGGAVPSFAAAGLDPACFAVAIGASTGGTEAITNLLKRAPADFPPTVMVQHMPVGFTRSFAARLNGLSPMRVAEAADGEPLRRGCALLARGDTQLVVRRGPDGWHVQYTHQQPVNRHCPSVDVLFASMAETVGRQAVAVLLTGMGADGAEGMVAVQRAGGLTVAQNEASCVVYGMPREAVARGAARYVGAPHDVPRIVLSGLQERQRQRRAPAHANTNSR